MKVFRRKVKDGNMYIRKTFLDDLETAEAVGNRPAWVQKL